MGAFDARATVETLDAPVGAERDPPIGLRALPGEPQHLRDRRFEVVVADFAARHPAQHGQRVDVALEERLLAAGGEHFVDGLAGIRQPEGEQIAAGGHPRQHDVHVPEVNLRLGAGQMSLRDEHVFRPDAGLVPDLLAPHRDIGADHLIRDLVRRMLIQQPLVNPLHVVLLFGRRVKVRLQHPVYHRLVRSTGTAQDCGTQPCSRSSAVECRAAGSQSWRTAG